MKGGDNMEESKQHVLFLVLTLKKTNVKKTKKN